MNKPELIQKIKASEGFSADEKAELISLLNNTKKYGLVWEDKPESVEEQLRTQLPVLVEVPERRILADDLPQPAQSAQLTNQPLAETPDLFSGTETNKVPIANCQKPKADNQPPNHILIEGDNLHALTALSFTHKGMIDVIYIDPPYNTGNKDFKYNDRFVDKEDSYRHSKWLSFMHKRLEIAKTLLKDEGFIAMSIGDDEEAQLKLLLDDIFLDNNFVSKTIRQAVKGGTRSKSLVAQNHDYLLVYAKNKSNCILKGRTIEAHILNLIDGKGPYMKGRELNKWGAGSRREDSPTMWFSIPGPDGQPVFPIRNDGSEGRWRWGKKKMQKAILEDELIFEKRDDGTYIVYEKVRNNNEREVAHSSLLVDSTYSNAYGTEELKLIFKGYSPFSYPKPSTLITYIANFAIEKKITILDFFAGSGTTLHATMQLNAEDGGNRQCILVTNNENNIAEEVCYERNKRVIQGYTNSKGVWVEGLTNNNLRYYKCDFVESAKTQQNRRKLTRLSTNLLQIKEDCCTDITATNGFDPEICHISTNGQGKYMIVVYHSRQWDETVAALRQWIKNLPLSDVPIALYAFADEQEVVLDDFYDVAHRIKAAPLPDAIYNAYRATFRSLKLEKKQPAAVVTEETAEEEETTE